MLVGSDPDNVGFKTFSIQPFFPESLEFAGAKHDCMYGSVWFRGKGGVDQTILDRLQEWMKVNRWL